MEEHCFFNGGFEGQVLRFKLARDFEDHRSSQKNEMPSLSVSDIGKDHFTLAQHAPSKSYLACLPSYILGNKCSWPLQVSEFQCLSSPAFERACSTVTTP